MWAQGAPAPELRALGKGNGLASIVNLSLLQTVRWPTSNTSLTQVHTEQPVALFDLMSPSMGAVDLHQLRSREAAAAAKR